MSSQSQLAKKTPITPPAKTTIASSQVRRYILDEKVLDLDANGIDDEDAKQIAVELASNTTLKNLRLNSNKIGNDGVVALAGALSVNKSLKILWLDFNFIGDSGMDALGPALILGMRGRRHWARLSKLTPR
jgi:Ran GTPase-activating protein (RanGAP) involved in mRNA processing and transport